GVVALTQRLADVALQTAPEFFPGRCEGKQELESRFDRQRRLAQDGSGVFVPTQAGPLDPVPVAILKVSKYGTVGLPFEARERQHSADLRNVRVRAQKVEVAQAHGSCRWPLAAYQGRHGYELPRIVAN